MSATNLYKTAIVLIVCLVRGSLSRHLALSLNLSVAFSDSHPSVTTDVVQTCLKETEISMADLNRFRMSLLENDPEAFANMEDDTVDGTVDGTNGDATNGDNNNDNNDDGTQYNVGDYDAATMINSNDKNDETLHCFVYCLYEQMGIVRNGIFLEPDLLRKLFIILERQKTPVRECMNLDSSNKCEASYKLHLCYSKLKSLEAERRIREILEYSENANEADADGEDIDINEANNPNDNNEANDADMDNTVDGSAGDPKKNEIGKY